VFLIGARMLAEAKPLPAPNHFSVAARTVWADDRENDERLAVKNSRIAAGATDLPVSSNPRHQLYARNIKM
jgi:NCAIR mutase (PurE)-related protein